LPRRRGSGPDRGRKGVRRSGGCVNRRWSFTRIVAKLPTNLSGRQVRLALECAGFEFRRQTGSHMVLRRSDPFARVVVPHHRQVRQERSGASSLTLD
jgi:predicted RNA binding protein YcfA (HicA-like mRNA interferase family)